MQRVIDALKRLPGIGPKSAERLTFALLRMEPAEIEQLADALVHLQRDLVTCSICHAWSQSDPCAICTDPRRDPHTLLVVEEMRDLLALERTGAYHGKYHVLGGVLSPLDGVGPEQLEVESLLHRVQQEQTQEVILATNPTVEGDATAVYLRDRLLPLGVTVSRLARGLPIGGDLEYADEVTLTRALEGRGAL
ncbi:MAG: recombination protein RecR [Firmicutes bacterium]|nr:recombination protein RecR [Bacillota bacterium]